MEVLLIEDDEDTGDALALLLELSGFGHQWARTGQEASLIFEHRGRNGRPMPDVLLLDLKLPDMNGDQLLNELTTWGEVPPVVIYSASSPVELGLAARRIGAAAVLRKPCSGRDLVATLHAVAGLSEIRARTS